MKGSTETQATVKDICCCILGIMDVCWDIEAIYWVQLDHPRSIPSRSASCRIKLRILNDR